MNDEIKIGEGTQDVIDKLQDKPAEILVKFQELCHYCKGKMIRKDGYMECTKCGYKEC